MGELKEKIYLYLHDLDTPAGKAVDFILLTVNLTACVLYVVITYQPLDQLPGSLIILEVALVSVFIVEYILRLWVTRGRKVRYIFSFFSIIDLLSILPIFFQVHTAGFLRSLRVLRILRFSRFLETEVFFFGRLTAFRLQAARLFFTIITITFIWAGFIHYAEAGRAGSAIETFADAAYFAIVTISTVGFGDITPTTEAGRWFTVLMILSGIFLIPWQAGRLAQIALSGGKSRRQVTCSRCGLKGHDEDASCCKACGEVLN
ncbi:MAG: ion transporter, partial [Gemmatimonadota bacterium]|nr:ion transporter [Gemmatimonadota bacterium]